MNLKIEQPVMFSLWLLNLLWVLEGTEYSNFLALYEKSEEKFVWGFWEECWGTGNWSPPSSSSSFSCSWTSFRSVGHDNIFLWKLINAQTRKNWSYYSRNGPYSTSEYLHGSLPALTRESRELMKKYSYFESSITISLGGSCISSIISLGAACGLDPLRRRHLYTYLKRGVGGPPNLLTYSEYSISEKKRSLLLVGFVGLVNSLSAWSSLDCRLSITEKK